MSKQAASSDEWIQRAASPDDLRAEGWSVAVHNDYRQNGEPHTFWLLTKENACIKGEGKTDSEALNMIRRYAASQTAPEPKEDMCSNSANAVGPCSAASSGETIYAGSVCPIASTIVSVPTSTTVPPAPAAKP